MKKALLVLLTLIMICGSAHSHWLDMKADMYEMSAKQGDPKAQYNLGVCYAYGLGVHIDDEKAIYWLKKAKEQNLAYAYWKLAIFHKYGFILNQDEEKEFEYITKAVEIISEHPDQYHNLNLLEVGEHNCTNFYDFGMNDITKTFFHEWRQGCEISSKYCEFWLIQSASKGHSEAQADLGYFYYRPNREDNNKAEYWLKKSAEAGHLDGIIKLANFYYLSGSHEDSNLYFYWINKACEQGDYVSQHQLGCDYLFGRNGILQDSIMAYALFIHSRKNGLDADNFLDATKKCNLSQEHIIEAQRLAKSLFIKQKR